MKESYFKYWGKAEKDGPGFHQAKSSARKGGEVAGKARNDLEKKTGKKVVSSVNYLAEPEGRKRLERKK